MFRSCKKKRKKRKEIYVVTLNRVVRFVYNPRQDFCAVSGIFVVVERLRQRLGVNHDSIVKIRSLYRNLVIENSR